MKTTVIAFAFGMITMLGISSSGFASTDQSVEQQSVSASDSKADLKLEGKLKCYYSRSGAFVYFVDLVKNSDGEALSISDPSDEIKAKCGAALTNYQVEGEITPKFLLWGGNLKVKSIQVSKN